MPENEQSIFYQKNGLAVHYIARDLYVSEIGDRMPTITEYCNQLGMGRGTIQAAITFLCANCISLVKQGHKGTMIADMNRRELWKYTGWNSVIAAFPMPVGNISTSLTEACNGCLQHSNIFCLPSFTVAMHNRLNALQDDRYGFVVVTKLVMDAISGQQQYNRLETALELTGCRYSTPYVLISSDPETKMRDGARLAVSTRSHEQTLLAKELCKQIGFRVYEMTSGEAIYALRDGTVDFMLGREDNSENLLPRHAPGINTYFHSLSFLGFDEASVTPVLVVNRDNYRMGELLRKNIDPQKVAADQNAILNGTINMPLF